MKLENKIDLVYIDPPFSTSTTFKFSSTRSSTVSMPRSGKVAYTDKFKRDEYLNFIATTLELLKKLLSEKGSIYFHIDYKVGHYIKVLMDEIFGEKNFRNDITRIKCNPKSFKRKGYSNIKDMILFYAMSKDSIWNEPREKYTNEQIEKLFKKIDEKGRRYTTVPLHAPGESKNNDSNLFKGLPPPEGRHWRTGVKTMEEWDKKGLIDWSKNNNPRKKFYLDEAQGPRVQDIWNFKDPQYPVYPTEKNSEFLEVIVNASSNEKSIVLDCFCGSGTTLKSANLLGRKWIGIDESSEAIKQTKQKLILLDSYDYKKILKR
jgi:adenine-specific DNA-methyltransferase